MKIVNVILVIFYLALSLVVGGTLLGISLDLIDSGEVGAWLNNVYFKLPLSWWVGALLIVIGLCTLLRYVRNVFHKRRVIFNKPQGQVSISLPAIEDFIKRSTANIEGLKDLKARVRVAGRNLSVRSRVALTSDVNVLDITEKIQAKIKDKIQNMVGVDNVSKVEIHVSKIVRKGRKEKQEESEIPYQGIDYGDGG